MKAHTEHSPHDVSVKRGSGHSTPKRSGSGHRVQRLEVAQPPRAPPSSHNSCRPPHSHLHSQLLLGQASALHREAAAYQGHGERVLHGHLGHQLTVLLWLSQDLEGGMEEAGVRVGGWRHSGQGSGQVEAAWATSIVAVLGSNAG